ncbi:MAG: hypothetical protein ABIJ48_11040, partial [Actinomycetota bacterium]
TVGIVIAAVALPFMAMQSDLPIAAKLSLGYLVLSGIGSVALNLRWSALQAEAAASIGLDGDALLTALMDRRLHG